MAYRYFELEVLSIRAGTPTLPTSPALSTPSAQLTSSVYSTTPDRLPSLDRSFIPIDQPTYGTAYGPGTLMDDSMLTEFQTGMEIYTHNWKEIWKTY